MKLSKIGPNLFLALAVILMAAQAFASAEKPVLECANEAVKVATARNHKRYDVSTNSCGAKLLSIGDHLETYLVCLTDETEPSEWVVVMKKKETNEKNEVVRKCAPKFADAQTDVRNPNFDDENDPALLKVWTCHAEFGVKGVTCQ